MKKSAPSQDQYQETHELWENYKKRSLRRSLPLRFILVFSGILALIVLIIGMLIVIT